MTAADVVQFHMSIPGMKCGTAVVTDGETVDTGLGETCIFVANAATADTVVTVASESAGVVTLGVETAGSGATDEVINWFAFHDRR